MATNTRNEPPRTRISLIRHGESNVTVGRLVGGRRTCTGLSPLGRAQAERLAARIRDTGELRPDVLLSSDFVRAIETAEIIQPALGPLVSGPIESWHDFGEHDPGPDCDGMSFAGYLERFGTPDWSGDPDAIIFPGGETITEFHTRISRALDTLMDRFRGRHVVVSCHGGVVDAVFRLLLDLPSTGGFVIESLNTAITEFSGPLRPRRTSDVDDEPTWRTGEWRVERVNDAAHLAGLPAASERVQRADGAGTG